MTKHKTPSPQPNLRVTEEMVTAAHNKMMSELFLLCQPNRGDVFSFMDDRRDVVRAVLSAALATIEGCRHCKGEGCQPGDPEGAPLEACDYCQGSGKTPSPETRAEPTPPQQRLTGNDEIRAKAFDTAAEVVDALLHVDDTSEYQQGVIDAVSAIRALQERNPAPHHLDAQDAARYRWLSAHFEDIYAVNAEGELVVQIKGVGLPDEDGAKLDAAIDAAMSQSSSRAAPNP